jgi:hypothetical protein
MQCDALPEIEELKHNLEALEESARIVEDLANGLPDHAEWLWRLADRLTSEATRMRSRLAAA